MSTSTTFTVNLEHQSSIEKILLKYFLRIDDENGYTFASFKNL